MINPSSGTDYGALQQNNPYRNYQYTRGLWDNVGDWMNKNLFFGNQVIKTPEQKYADEMANKANVYDAQIGEVQREEMFNSATEQAQRMRDAGINPDLQNSGITGGEASPMDNQAVDNLPVTSDDIEGSKSIISKLISIPSTVAAMVKGLPNLSKSFDEAKTQRLNYFSTLGDTMTGWITDHINEFDGITNQKEFLGSQIFKDFMNDPEIKHMFPFSWQRKEAALVMYRKAKSMYTGEQINAKRGSYMASELDPMNSDATLVGSIVKLNAYLMESKLKFDSEYQKKALELGLPSNLAESENEEANAKVKEYLWNYKVYGALSGLVDYYNSLFEQTGDSSYNLAVLACQSLMENHWQSFLALSGASLVDLLLGGTGPIPSSVDTGSNGGEFTPPRNRVNEDISNFLGETDSDKASYGDGREFRDAGEIIAQNARDAVREYFHMPSERKQRQKFYDEKHRSPSSSDRKSRKHFDQNFTGFLSRFKK